MFSLRLLRSWAEISVRFLGRRIGTRALMSVKGALRQWVLGAALSVKEEVLRGGRRVISNGRATKRGSLVRSPMDWPVVQRNGDAGTVRCGAITVI